MNAGRLPFSEIVIDISDNPHWEKKKKVGIIIIVFLIESFCPI